jgi:peptidoglycan hydrolase CwlO-like protein
MSFQRTTTSASAARINTFATTNSGTIISYIINNDFHELSTVINTNNVNTVIDTERGYTALHYAIQFHRYKMIEYLLKIGASTTIKTKNEEDAYDLSLQYQCKEAITFKLKEKDDIIKEHDKIISELQKKNKVSEDNIKYMTKAMDDGNMKQAILKKENGELKRELISVNKKYDASITEANGLSTTIDNLDTSIFKLRNEVTTLKTEKETISGEHNSLKRKYDNLQKSFDGLASKMKKT